MKMVVSLAFAVTLVSSPAFAQVTSLQSANPAPKGQDLNRIVCEVEETTGSRLGARKVCKTVLEWQQLKREHRDTLEKFQQQNTNIPVSG